MRRCIAIHLSLGKAARPGAIARSRPLPVWHHQGRIDGKAWRRCPLPLIWPASLTAPGSGDLPL